MLLGKLNKACHGFVVTGVLKKKTFCEKKSFSKTMVFETVPRGFLVEPCRVLLWQWAG